jgi:hypothetical protein
MALGKPEQGRRARDRLGQDDIGSRLAGGPGDGLSHELIVFIWQLSVTFVSTELP